MTLYIVALQAYVCMLYVRMYVCVGMLQPLVLHMEVVSQEVGTAPITTGSCYLVASLEAEGLRALFPRMFPFWLV